MKDLLAKLLENKLMVGLLAAAFAAVLGYLNPDVRKLVVDAVSGVNSGTAAVSSGQ